MGFVIPGACPTASAGFGAEPQGVVPRMVNKLRTSRPYAALGKRLASAPKYASSGVFQSSD